MARGVIQEMPVRRKRVFFYAKESGQTSKRYIQVVVWVIATGDSTAAVAACENMIGGVGGMSAGQL
jgi:hypothetical protein